MKRVMTVVVCLLLFAANKALAYNLKYFSNDSKILSALEVLEKNGGTEVLDNLMDNGVKVIFYDLSMIDSSFSEDYAISSLNQMGKRYILINSRFRNCPKEALACLIAHESFHKSIKADFTEEVKCTQKEAEYWHRLKTQISSIDNTNDYIQRLNRLEGLYITSDKINNKIARSIQQHDFYRTQLGIK